MQDDKQILKNNYLDTQIYPAMCDCECVWWMMVVFCDNVYVGWARSMCGCECPGEVG